MKVWNAYGSEHSMNLVMIGRFKEVHDAEQAKELIDRLIEQVGKEPAYQEPELAPEDQRFSSAMFALLSAAKVYTIGATELCQFAYDATIRIVGNEVVLTTDESDVSAFLKVLIDRGARVEVYSAHDYPGTGHGRGG